MGLGLMLRPVACLLWCLPGTSSSSSLGKAEAFQVLPQAGRRKHSGRDVDAGFSVPSHARRGKAALTGMPRVMVA